MVDQTIIIAVLTAVGAAISVLAGAISHLYVQLGKAVNAHTTCQVELAALRVEIQELRTNPLTHNEAIIRCGMDGIITNWNLPATLLFLWEHDEVCGIKHISALMPSRFIREHQAKWDDVVKTGRTPMYGPILAYGKRKDHTEIPVSITLSKSTDRVTGKEFFTAFMSVRTPGESDRGHWFPNGSGEGSLPTTQK